MSADFFEQQAVQVNISKKTRTAAGAPQIQKRLWLFFYYGIYPVEGIGVFRVPKNGDARNKKPPALRVETKRCTKKSPFRYNRVVQALL